MSKTFRIALAAALAAALALAPVWTAPAAAAPERADAAPAGPSLWHLLERLFGPVWAFGGSTSGGDAGPQTDPNGAAAPAGDSSDAGPERDPNGLTAPGGGSDAGPERDPDGDHQDAGPEWDPNG